MTPVVKKSNGSLSNVLDKFWDESMMLPRLLDLNLGIQVPSANIIENDKDFVIEISAPGKKREDFKVEVNNGILTVSSEKKEEKEEKEKNYYRQEFSYESFSRSFRLPENLLHDNIAAKYEDGILRLTLPKKEVTPVKPVKEIKVS